MSTQKELFNQLTTFIVADDVWDVSRTDVNEGVIVTPINEWEETEQPTRRAGGEDYQPEYRLVILDDGQIECLAYEIRRWHGGVHSGHLYTEYTSWP